MSITQCTASSEIPIFQTHFIMIQRVLRLSYLVTTPFPLCAGAPDRQLSYHVRDPCSLSSGLQRTTYFALSPCYFSFYDTVVSGAIVVSTPKHYTAAMLQSLLIAAVVETRNSTISLQSLTEFGLFVSKVHINQEIYRQYVSSYRLSFYVNKQAWNTNHVFGHTESIRDKTNSYSIHVTLLIQ
jgi:hypothetical protein